MTQQTKVLIIAEKPNTKNKYIRDFDALLDSKINQAQELLERTLHLYAQACHHALSPHACGL